MAYKLVTSNQTGGSILTYDQIIKEENDIYYIQCHGEISNSKYYCVPENTYLISLVPNSYQLDDQIAYHIAKSENLNTLIKRLNDHGNEIIKNKSIKGIVKIDNNYNGKRFNIYGPGELILMPKLIFNTVAKKQRTNNNNTAFFEFKLPTKKTIKNEKKNITILKYENDADKEAYKLLNTVKNVFDVYIEYMPNTKQINIYGETYYVKQNFDTKKFFDLTSDSPMFLRQLGKYTGPNYNIHVVEQFKLNDFIIRVHDANSQYNIMSLYYTEINTFKNGVFKLPLTNPIMFDVNESFGQYLENSNNILLENRNKLYSESTINVENYNITLPLLNKLSEELKYNEYSKNFNLDRFLMNHKVENLNEIIEEIETNKTRVFILGHCRNFSKVNLLKNTPEVRTLTRSMSISYRGETNIGEINVSLDQDHLLFNKDIITVLYYILCKVNDDVRAKTYRKILKDFLTYNIIKFRRIKHLLKEIDVIYNKSSKNKQLNNTKSKFKDQLKSICTEVIKNLDKPILQFKSVVNLNYLFVIITDFNENNYISNADSVNPVASSLLRSNDSSAGVQPDSDLNNVLNSPLVDIISISEDNYEYDNGSKDDYTPDSNRRIKYYINGIFDLVLDNCTGLLYDDSNDGDNRDDSDDGDNSDDSNYDANDD